MSLTDADRLLLGWFLVINPEERKNITVTDLRCPRGCLLGAVVTIERRLYVLGLFDPATTASAVLTNPGTTTPATPSRWTLEALRDLTVREFLELREAGAVRRSDLSRLSLSNKYAVVYPLNHTRKVLRCRHLFGQLPEEYTPDLTGRTVIVRSLEHVPPLRDLL